MVVSSPTQVTPRVPQPPVPPRVAVEALPGWEAVAAGAWDALVPPGRAALRHACLRAWGRAELSGLRPRPIVARSPDGDRLLATAPGCFYDLDLAEVNGPVFPRAVRAARRAVPRLLTMRVFEIGCSTALAMPLLSDPAIDHRTAAELLLRAAIREADAGGAPLIIVQDFASASAPAAGALGALGFTRVPILPTLVVDTPHASFDDYLGAMRASYRRRARRVMAQSEHLRVERVRDFGPLTAELARLWRQVFDRAEEMKREVLSEAYFAACAALDDTSVLLLRREDGSIASFALLLDDRPWLHFQYCGFEERAGREEGAYFRLLYEIVRAGIEGGFERVNLGITTAAPKLDVGAVPVELFAWFRYRRQLLQRVFDRVGTRPFAPPPVERRRVFKS